MQDNPLTYGKKHNLFLLFISSFENCNLCGYIIYKPSNEVPMVYKQINPQTLEHFLGKKQPAIPVGCTQGLPLSRCPINILCLKVCPGVPAGKQQEESRLPAGETPPCPSRGPG